MQQVEQAEQPEIERRVGSRGVALLPLVRRRVRTGQRALQREAARRRTKSNMMMLGSVGVVAALVALFYEVLSH